MKIDTGEEKSCDVIIRPYEIDFDTMLKGDETPVSVGSFEYFTREVERAQSKLVMVYDYEGMPICIAPVAVARWLIKLMNAAGSITTYQR